MFDNSTKDGRRKWKYFCANSSEAGQLFEDELVS
jgi:hypothetical protein